MSLVEIDRNDAVLTITLADEAGRNSLSERLVAELLAALDTADADPDVRVVVLTNRGKVFCAGANLAERAASDEAPAAIRAPKELFGRFRRSPKPYVGRIAGHCVAGGMGLAAAMDISVAVDTALFGFTEVRIGVAPAVISVVCLPKLSPVDARSSFLRGNRFPATEAARMGLITSAVPAERLDVEIDAVIADLLAASPAAIAAAKELLDRVPTMTVDDAFDYTARRSAEMFASADAAEGMRAYLDKRPAAWVRPVPGKEG